MSDSHLSESDFGKGGYGRDPTPDPAPNPARPAEYTLLGTTDAMVWAQEFCRIFDGRMITAATHPNEDVDVGTMLGWFANALETGINAGKRWRNDG